jgi:hypothetical protein
LEPRELLSAAISESFDSTPPGQLPAGWAQWGTPGAAIAVTASASVSRPNALGVTGGTPDSARAWYGTAQPADVQVSAAIDLTSLIPAQVFARGSGLNGTAPSFYAVSVTRGLQLQLLRVVGGSVTTLASLPSANYFSQQWVSVTLSAQGSQLQAQLQRLDTGQYLTASGTWQAGPTWALSVTDTALSGAGQVGVGRPASYSGTVLFDDFAAAPLASPGSPQPPGGGALPRPSIPQHYSWIRLAELAYSGTPIDATMQQLLQNSIDLVVPNTAYLGTLHSDAPNTPGLIYTNLSNLYGSALTSWLNYADAHGVSREEAFYHVTAPTPFSGDSASSQPVNWFWGVYRGGSSWTDVTSQAHGGGNGNPVAFAPAGGVLAVGYTDPFNQINVALASPAGAGWSAVLEYPTAVDASGHPTAWGTLTTTSDTTAGLTQSGQVTFDPPADWVTASINGSARLYYVRYRTTASGTAPVATRILGADYVQANGTTSGVIPAFDYAADANHDGYLNDAEYAVALQAGDTARFAYQSRLFAPYYGQMRFAANPAGADFRAWAASYEVSYLQSNPLAAGLFVDNSGGKAPVGPGVVAEAVGSYTADYAGLLTAVGQAIAPDWLLANTSADSAGDTVSATTQAAFDEFALRPLASTYQGFENAAAAIAAQQASSSPAPYVVLDSLPTGGAPTDRRTQIATLAEYYLLADPTTTFLDFFGGYAPSSSWSQHWSPAAAYDVGQPQGGWSLWASGADPSNAALTYRVYARSYGNALVLYKPLSYAHGVSGTLADSSATVHALGGSYQVLQADGTLGPVVTSITLRNGEGAILVKVTQPPTAPSAPPSAPPLVTGIAAASSQAAVVDVTASFHFAWGLVRPPHSPRVHRVLFLQNVTGASLAGPLWFVADTGGKSWRHPGVRFPLALPVVISPSPADVLRPGQIASVLFPDGGSAGGLRGLALRVFQFSA